MQTFTVQAVGYVTYRVSADDASAALDKFHRWREARPEFRIGRGAELLIAQDDVQVFDDAGQLIHLPKPKKVWPKPLETRARIVDNTPGGRTYRRGHQG